MPAAIGRTSTPWAWLLALTPLAAAAALEPVLLAFARATAFPSGTRVPDAVSGQILIAVLIDLIASATLIPLGGLLAWLDARALRRDGLGHPFGWGWGFLPYVYLIGRAVTLGRATGRGAGPLVLTAALFALALLVVLVQFALTFVSLM